MVAAITPVPLNDTVCGLLLAVSVKLNVPDRVPVALGENITEAVQLAPPAKVAGLVGQVVEVTPKSAKLLAMDLNVNAVDWLLVRVTVCAALLVPKACLAKVRVVGVSVTAAIPVPLRLTVCGLLLALSVTFRLPLRTPTAVGVNVMEMVQVLPAARVEGLIGQVFVWV